MRTETAETGTLTAISAETGAGLRMRSANEWLIAAVGTPAPERLFGEYWLEGELAIMFADTGKGKSVLGVQIAEAIARGRDIGPIESDTEPQTVLYFDFEQTEMQFGMRYTRDADEVSEGEPIGRYTFSDRLKRIDIDLEAGAATEAVPNGEVLLGEIESVVRTTGARVLVIDNLSFLKGKYETAAETISMMNRLRRLRARYGLSILLTAHTLKREMVRPLSAGDMQGSKVLANMADNIFAIGASRSDPDLRYLKHIKHRGTAGMYDAGEVPTFRLAKSGGNFLSFCFKGFSTEAEMQRVGPEHIDWPLIDRIKELADEGQKIRDIAAELEISKSRAHRLLQRWEPPPAPPPVPERTPDDLWSPTPEAYEGEHTDNAMIAMGYKRRPWQEKLEAEQLAAAETETYDDDLHEETDEEAIAKLKAQFADRRGDEEFGEEQLDLSEPEAIDLSEPASEEPDPHAPDLASMKRSLDGYGREIWVERHDERGKPVIWYQFDTAGNLYRHERKGFTIIRDLVVRREDSGSVGRNAGFGPR